MTAEAPSTPVRIAMWSGPRNVSTALMRSFGNRPDTHVVDEPLYPQYLFETGNDHPGFDDIVAECEIDWKKVVATLTGPLPAGKTLHYQKHMAHHLLFHIERDWMEDLRHAFLIRDPKEMLISLDKVTPDPELKDTGLTQQVEIFEAVQERTGTAPPVIDTRDLLEHPEPMLRKLCEALDVAFLPEMLSWPPGPRDTDGIWAPHWYASVEASTGFAPYRAKGEELPERLAEVHRECLEPYGKLHAARLTP